MTSQTVMLSNVYLLVSNRRLPERTVVVETTSLDTKDLRCPWPAAKGSSTSSRQDQQTIGSHHRGGLRREAVARRAEGSHRCGRPARLGGNVSDGLMEALMKHVILFKDGSCHGRL